MKKHITNEKTGISYTLQGDYYLPDLALPSEEEQPIGAWGQRHLLYIRQHKPLLYSNLLTSGKLNVYLADVDRQAKEMFSRLVKQMANREGITETLKAKNQMMWVGKMNNIRNRANEIINSDLIYNGQVAVNNHVNNNSATNDIPKIFWKYFDLYRRKKITLVQYSENTGLPIAMLERFLREVLEKSAKNIESVKEL